MMNEAGRWLARHQAVTGLALLVAMALPPLRSLLEARMSSHMLLQFPVLLLAGALLAGAIPPAVRQRLQGWNAHGMAGLVFAALVLALSMVPRLLDLVLVNPLVEAVKFAALLLCGVALRGSWRRAGLGLQAFFLGNTLPMMAVAGWLYETASVRLCNAYRLDEQVWLGQTLSWTAAGIAALWLGRITWRMSRQDPRDALAITHGALLAGAGHTQRSPDAKPGTGRPMQAVHK
ncbi:hypothetical protein [Acidovorax sp. SDU_ACID1]|uniref:hypothetical protein n=1 Tax=Acidovorax sp. SDU_ACID1 TaxID=3136632 RepID=UPI003872EB3B